MRAIAIGLLLALLIASPAIADTKRVTWTNATQNTDGTAIPTTGPGSLVRTTIEYGTCTGNPKTLATKQGEIFVAAPQNQEAMLPLVVVQEFCLVAFHSNTFATTFAACVSGSPGSPTCPQGNSDRSNVVVTQGGPPRPRPPTSANVDASSPVAWTPITTDEAIAGLAVGTARAGARCDTTQSFSSPNVANGETLYRVPVADVDLLPGQAPLVAFTRCSG